MGPKLRYPHARPDDVAERDGVGLTLAVADAELSTTSCAPFTGTVAIMNNSVLTAVSSLGALLVLPGIISNSSCALKPSNDQICATAQIKLSVTHKHAHTQRHVHTRQHNGTEHCRTYRQTPRCYYTSIPGTVSEPIQEGKWENSQATSRRSNTHTANQACGRMHENARKNIEKPYRC